MWSFLSREDVWPSRPSGLLSGHEVKGARNKKEKRYLVVGTRNSYVLCSTMIGYTRHSSLLVIGYWLLVFGPSFFVSRADSTSPTPLLSIFFLWHTMSSPRPFTVLKRPSASLKNHQSRNPLAQIFFIYLPLRLSTLARFRPQGELSS